MSPTPTNSGALGAQDPLSNVALTITQDGDAGLTDAIADSTTYKTSLLDLAAELHASIAEVLDNESLLSFRQVSRKLEMNSNDVFLDRFFRKRRHLLTTQSMQVLAEISATPPFARHIQEIELLTFQVDPSLNHVKEIKKWFSEEGARFRMERLALFHDVLRGLARLGLSSVVKIKCFNDGFSSLNDNIFRRNHIEDGRRRERESIYGLQNLRARLRLLWALTGVQKALLLYPYDVDCAAQDFLLALADHPHVVEHLELGTTSHYSVDSGVNLPRLTSTQPESLRLACANITTLRLGIRVSPGNIKDLRLKNHQTSAVLYLLRAAVNVTTLDILLQPTYDMRAIWAEFAHLNLRSMGIGGCYGSYQSLTEILSQHKGTMEVLRLDNVFFTDAPAGPVDLLSWMGGNLNLKQFCVHECYALDESWYKDTSVFNPDGGSSFELISDEDGTVSDKLRDAEIGPPSRLLPRLDRAKNTNRMKNTEECESVGTSEEASGLCGQ